ncbi:MAG TPA: adenylate/guanylate cyclase domain-containing protein [Polyangiaceae bacterium]|jgi:adenylate cyclase|nr:adenylate/guanylate cyclase domain-containing protein [Polyangiaceae bacterium]
MTNRDGGLLNALSRPTLGQAFFAAIVAVAVVVAVAFAVFLSSSRASILDTSERQRRAEAHRIEARVAASLGRAESVLNEVERAIHTRATEPDDRKRLEALLFTELVGSPELEEVTFTRARLLPETDPNAPVGFEPEGRWQLSAHRTPDGRVFTRDVHAEGSSFAVRERDHGNGASFDTAAMPAPMKGADPTLHPTFSVLAGRAQRGRAIWSDLHYSELDVGDGERRVVLSVQRSVDDADGHFAGVARVGLLTTDLDGIVKASTSTEPDDPHRVALLAVSSRDRTARLVARVAPDDRVEEMGDELRIRSLEPPKELAALLASPLVHDLDPAHPSRGGELDVDGERYLATLEPLSTANGGTEGWLAAVVVPERHYTKDLVRLEHVLLLLAGGTLVLVLTIGAITLGVVRRGLREVTQTTAMMRAFDFTPRIGGSRIREIDDVASGLERAKTVSRAMGKYVPLDLVKRLYESNAEPALGGELSRLSMMFSDIEGFTSLSEKLTPDALAAHLGFYLEAMTTAIEATGGTIDKYIGDAVMAFWNAPQPTPEHPKRACEAVLACKESLARLYASPAWKGLPSLVTRFGVHEAEVMVGHFGAPTRLSYTALGDGVNLAARLEPLCKQYGVTVLVSETIAKDAGTDFAFRRIDRVAVKGKARGIDVYELLGKAGEAVAGLAEARRYEEAFDAYLLRDFVRAMDLLDEQPDDQPSQVLRARCKLLKVAPPPSGWDGTHIASAK